MFNVELVKTKKKSRAFSFQFITTSIITLSFSSKSKKLKLNNTKKLDNKNLFTIITLIHFSNNIEKKILNLKNIRFN